MGPLIALQAASLAINIYGSAKAAKLAKAVGRMRNRAAKQHALQVVAAGQRVSFEEQRQAELLASRAVAVAAAGGGNTDDPSISKIIEDIHGEGAYRASVAMYEAESEADRVRFEGRMAEMGGEQEAKNIRGQMLGQAVSSGANMYAYNKLGLYG